MKEVAVVWIGCEAVTTKNTTICPRDWMSGFHHRWNWKIMRNSHCMEVYVALWMIVFSSSNGPCEENEEDDEPNVVDGLLLQHSLQWQPLLLRYTPPITCWFLSCLP